MNQAPNKANGGVLAMGNGLPVVSLECQGIETLLTARQVAGILQVSPGWVRDHANRKQPHLRCVHVGDLLRFRREDLEEFIKEWCR